MINPNLLVNKALREQLDTCMNITFITLTQPFIKNTVSKNNTSVLAFIIFHETRCVKAKK